MLDVAKQDVRKRQSVAIHADVADAFQAACKGRAVGRSMNDAATRIVQWFVRQPQPVQTAVVSDVDAGMERQYATALRRLADELEGKVEPHDAPEPNGGRLGDDMGPGVYTNLDTGKQMDVTPPNPRRGRTASDPRKH